MPATGFVRHRPGPGLAVGLCGLLLALLSFVALPWVSDGGQDVTLLDVRDQFEGTDPPSEVAYIVGYARWVWIVVLAVAAIALLIAAVFVPSSKAARIVISCLTFGFLGLFAIGVGFLVNAGDKRGVVGPRINGAFLASVAIAAHAWAYADWFTDTGAPDPAIGVWIGFLGLAAVLAGCLIGTRTEPTTATPPVASPYADTYGAP